jgi:hypothetical protein
LRSKGQAKTFVQSEDMLFEYPSDSHEGIVAHVGVAACASKTENVVRTVKNIVFLFMIKHPLIIIIKKTRLKKRADVDNRITVNGSAD